MNSFTLDKIEFDAVRRILGEFCVSSTGRRMAGKIGPSRKAEVVSHWLELTTQMVAAVQTIGLAPFAGIRDISEPLGRGHPGGGLTGEDLASIAEALEGAGNLRKYLLEMPDNLGKLRDLAEGIDVFDDELAAIHSVVAGDGSIRDDASERLAELRRKIARTSQRIHDAIYSYLQKPQVARLLQQPTVTLQGGRYVLPVKIENRGRLPGVVHRMSHTGATAFIEPSECVELNNHLADLYVDEQNEVQRLLNDLAVLIQARGKSIETSMRNIAHLDVLSAKAQYAYRFDMTCPQVRPREPLQLTAARHPLLIDQAFRQERQGVELKDRLTVVPIDVRLGSDFDLLVITGSNTGGKTVTLKTLALLSVMAQSGMHIPAGRGAKLPLFDNIFIDVGDEQSLEQSLSTFGAHVSRLRSILAKTTKSSLVLLDELGAGTDPDEGGAIGQAVLDELRRIGCLGMVTTHLSILKAYAMSHKRVDNASVAFDTKTLSPTYHLSIGTPGESHAITVAARLGLPKQVIESARRHLGARGKRFRLAIRATGAVRRSAEAARGEAHRARQAAQDQTQIYEAKLADIRALQGEFTGWLARLADMKAGDDIFVPSLDKRGHLVRLELHKQRAVVDVDNLQVEVPLGDLMPDLGQEVVRKQIAASKKEMVRHADAARADAAEALRVRHQHDRMLRQHRDQAKRFDMWLGAIGRLKIGDDVPITRKPGHAKVLQVDMLALRATVETPDGPMVLSLQDLFPQTGPFAPQTARRPQGKPSTGKGPHKPSTRPMPRRQKVSRSKQQRILELKPGMEVFIVPFSKRATLIRINVEKKHAIVQSGAFELEVPLADVDLPQKKA